MTGTYGALDALRRPVIWGGRAVCLLLASVAVADAQTTICVKNVTSSPVIDGVVASGAPSPGCPADPVWGGISPAEFQPSTSSPEAQLYLARRAATNRLFIGVAVRGDAQLSDADYVLLYFDADGSGTWNNGDFAIQVQVSGATGTAMNPLINSGVQCGVPAAQVTYWRYDATASGTGFDQFWKTEAAPVASIQAAIAWDYTATTGDDLEDRIWNLELEIPTTGTHFNLNTSAPAFFRVGAYVFVDHNHQDPPLGQVRAWPGELYDASIAVNFTNPNAVNNAVPGMFPVAADLAVAALDDICFDVSFSTPNAWRINNIVSETNNHNVNPGVNNFTVTFKYDGPDGAAPPLPNSGRVWLRMKPFGTLPPGHTSTSLMCEHFRDVTVDNVNGVASVPFDNINLGACTGWPSLGQLSFICVDLELEGFQRDDNKTNNTKNINYNYFSTSQYSQTVFLSADGVPDLRAGETTTLLLHVEPRNDPGAHAGSGAGPLGRFGNRSWPGSSRSALATLLASVLVLSFMWWLLARRLPVRLRYAPAFGLLLLAAVITACVHIGILDPERGQPRWHFANASQLGIRPVPGDPGWYTMPIRQGDLVRLDLEFRGMPLPYETQTMRLTPAEDRPITLNVRPGEVVSVFAFGQIDLDGPDGQLMPVTANGFVLPSPRLRPQYRLHDGYYRPDEYVGALIGSFDAFEQTSFPIGRSASLVVPQGARTLTLAVNVPRGTEARVSGAFDLRVIQKPSVRVPTFGTIQGDATFQAPAVLPAWAALTGVSLYTYYQVDNVVDGRVVARTRQPLGFSHHVVYESHGQTMSPIRPR